MFGNICPVIYVSFFVIRTKLLGAGSSLLFCCFFLREYFCFFFFIQKHAITFLRHPGEWDAFAIIAVPALPNRLNVTYLKVASRSATRYD